MLAPLTPLTRSMLSLGLVWVITALPVNAVAQTEREGRRHTYRERAERTTTQKEIRTGDQHLAMWLLVDHQTQHAISRFARTHAEADSVHEFASELVETYSQAIARLQDFVTARETVVSEFRNDPDEDDSRQRVRATAADEVQEKNETEPVLETKTAASGTGQESGPTGTRARDVRQGETGTDNARTITEPDFDRPRVIESAGPAGVGTRGRNSVKGTVADEMRARDRRLDAFDRVGKLPVSEQNRRNNVTDEERPQRRSEESVRWTRRPVPDSAQTVMNSIGQERISLILRELDHAPSIDRSFLQHQVSAQLYSLSVLRGLKAYVSSELREFIEETEETHWSHFDRAQELLQDLEH